MTTLLGEVFEGREPDLTEENLQARIRGNLLMALSNKFGWLVLTTGNKSEMAVGYSTLYGDSAGGFAVIKDCPKTLVYAAGALPQREVGPVIPESILERAPSAELRPDQRDDDSLPPYEVLDPILRRLRRGRSGPRGAGRSAGSPRRTSSGSSRWSTAPNTSAARRRRGSRSPTKAFGRDRRVPITNRYGG